MIFESVTTGEAIQIVATLVTGCTIIAVLKNDIKWIIKWFEDHKQVDDDRYEELKQELRAIHNSRRGRWWDEG